MPRFTVARYEENFPGSDYSAEEADFLRAIDRYKTMNRRWFLTWREVLRIAKALGYRRVAAPAAALPKPSDWNRYRVGA